MSCERDAILQDIVKQMSAMNNQIERIISWMEAIAPQLKPGDKSPVAKTKHRPVTIKQASKQEKVLLPDRKKLQAL